MLLIILASIFIRSSASRSLRCEILSKAFSQSKKIKIMFWYPVLQPAHAEKRFWGIFAPPESNLCVSLTMEWGFDQFPDKYIYSKQLKNVVGMSPCQLL